MAANDGCAEAEEAGKGMEDTELTADATPPEPEENILSNPDEIADVVLEVEGRELHTSRAVLAHYSPVFRAMFYSSFKEKSSVKVPLPGKQYAAMVTFCNVLYPRSASAKCLNDDNLIPLLTLAEEYKTDPVKVECQAYIRGQLCGYFLHFYRISVLAAYKNKNPSDQNFRGVYDRNIMLCRRGETAGQRLPKGQVIQKLVLYLWACDAHQLPAHREVVLSLLVDVAGCLRDVARSRHYPSLPLASKVDLLEALCRKFDGSGEQEEAVDH